MGSVEDGLDSLFVWPKGRTIRKIMGGGGEEGWVGNFWAAGIFFSLSNSSYEFFLGCAWIFFHLIFPCANIFFVLRLPPQNSRRYFRFEWSGRGNWNFVKFWRQPGEHHEYLTPSPTHNLANDNTGHISRPWPVWICLKVFFYCTDSLNEKYYIVSPGIEKISQIWSPTIIACVAGGTKVSKCSLMSLQVAFAHSSYSYIS